MHVGQGFIGEVSKQVIDRYASELHRVTIVVPAKRSLRFFKNNITALLSQQAKASILPEMITMAGLMERLSPYTVLTPLELSFHFYKVYTALEKDPEPFEKFYGWAPALLADFNEVDNYLVYPPHLFRDLKNIKEIEEWSFSDPDWSPGQELLNKFWEKIPAYYKAFNEYLAEKKLAYHGMSNKYIAVNAKSIFDAGDKRHYVFAGFNALTACEQAVIQYLNKEYAAPVFFDADRYYVDHEFHEAGLFIRGFEKMFEKECYVIDAENLLQEEKNIHYYECSGEALQCSKLVSMVEHESRASLENSAIVLCNEQLLPVLVGEFPNELLRVNVTMGWPLRFTNTNDFLQALIEIHIALQRNRNYVPYDHVKHFLDIAASVFVLEEKEKIPEVINYHQLVAFFNNSEIKVLLEPKGDDILSFIESVKKFLHQLIQQGNMEELQSEIFAHFFEVFSRLAALPGFSENIKSWYLFKRFFQSFSKQYPLAFLGEPMMGIQVMGMLETRGIDFDKVYVLSGNEGFLPVQQNISGFIPYDLRKFVKLPGKAEQDAVFAYYFYRLIQRAKEVHVFYNGQSELLQQSEKSRYLLQIEKELAELNKNITLTKTYVSHQPSPVVTDAHPDKTAFYYDLLKQYSDNGFSASMLSTYMNCPLDFYFKYILGFKEEKDPQYIEESDIGNIIHGFFQHEFTPLQGTKLEAKHVQASLGRVDIIVDGIIREEFRQYDFASGENYLALQLIHKMITSFLQQQLEPGNFNSILGKVLLGSELKAETRVLLNSGREVKIKGTIDLLMNDGEGKYFIYDFKTGKANEEDLVIPAKGNQVRAVAKKNKLLQLLIYQRLVKNNFAGVKTAKAFIIPLATGAGKFLPAPANASDGQLLQDTLTMIIENMFSKEEPLQHEVSSKFCSFCD